MCITITHDSGNQRLAELVHLIFSTIYPSSAKLSAIEFEPTFTKCLADAMQYRLNDREMMVLNHRFGLNGHGELTLQAMGSRIDRTREAIRQIELRAISKLKLYSTLYELSEHIKIDGRRLSHSIVSRGHASLNTLGLSSDTNEYLIRAGYTTIHDLRLALALGELGSRIPSGALTEINEKMTHFRSQT